MWLTAYGETDTGRRRTQNQDRILVHVAPATDAAVGLFAVADGMGGQSAGDVASRLTLETIEQDLIHFIDQTILPSLQADAETERLSLDDPGTGAPVPSFRDALLDAILRSNRRIRDFGDSNPESAGLGSTLTIALVVGDLALIGNIGDSRTYLVRDGTIRRLTQDHSLVSSLVRQGLITDEEVYNHPHRNLVYQALGTREDVSPDIAVERLQSGDVLLLCSDGLWEMVRDEEIRQVVAEEPQLEPAVSRLIHQANANGGVDNISVVLVRVR
jgi:serine/threonine protein phosphatase PrpC